MTRLLSVSIATSLAASLTACAPAPEGAYNTADGKGAAGVQAVMDVGCADPSCSTLFLDGSSSTAPAGVRDYTWTLPDGTVSHEAWVFLPAPASNAAVQQVAFVVTDDDDNSDVQMLDLLAFAPNTAEGLDTVVWTPWKVNATGQCEVSLNIGGCLQGVQAVTFKAGQTLAQLNQVLSIPTNISLNQTHVAGPIHGVPKDEIIFLSATKIFQLIEPSNHVFTFHCRDGLIPY